MYWVHLILADLQVEIDVWRDFGVQLDLSPPGQESQDPQGGKKTSIAISLYYWGLAVRYWYQIALQISGIFYYF